MKRLLIVEDDPAISKTLVESLEAEHFSVSAENDGLQGYERASQNHFDVIILDIMLPGKNGFEICQDLRKNGSTSFILMLTSKKDEIDKVLGLQCADDYMTKPFGLRELHARIQALLRRGRVPRSEIDVYSFGDVYLDFRKQEAKKGDKTLLLSAKEFDIMHFFAQHEEEVVTRDMLLDEVWGYEAFPTTRTVDNYILNLRKKIETDPANPRHILTKHKSGYKFVK